MRYLLVLLLLAGCASTGEVIPVGKGSYTVSAQMGGQFPAWSDVKELALKKANAYCDGLGNEMIVGKWDTHGARGWTPLNAELTFQCAQR